MRCSAARRVRGGALALSVWAAGVAALAPGGLFAPRAAGAQARQVALGADSSARGPRWGDVLARRVTVHLADTPMEPALRYIAQIGALRLSYSSDIVPAGRRVTLSRERTPVGDILREALTGTDLDFLITPAGYVVIVRSPSARSAAPDDSGVPAIARVAVRPQLMDRVIVMGTPAMGAPERELATAVTVLTSNQIAQSGASSMLDLFRSGIPGIVAWDLGITGPFAQIGSVRGASSFTSNYLKTYVDGVELASPYLLFAIDPTSVERIEVIRGPQGSALYGSDAISGVVQVVTRRGSMSAAWRPQLDLGLSAGLAESKYVTGTSPLQRYTGFGSSGGGTTSLGFGGTYESSGEIAPGGGASYRGTFGGVRHLLGRLRLEGSMRYADVRFTAAPNPFFNENSIGLNNAAAGDEVRPLLEQQRIQNETYGATADYQPFDAWRHTVVVGLDRHAGAIPSQREPATVADILLGANSERVSKSSLRYSTALRLPPTSLGAATLTLGAEHAALTRERLGNRSDVVGSGEGVTSLYTDHVTNSGVFGQLKLEVAHSLFLTGGLRGEHNSNFGRFYSTAWSPMVGAAFTRDVGQSTYKLRWAYGKGIRPPPSSARRAITTVSYRQLENPELQPEVQGGSEAGLEWYAGDRASLSVTAYQQNAEGLVQQVIITRADKNQLRSIQYQNVGRIANRGVELEGSARAGELRAAMSFALTDSRVRALSATYRGELRIGDRVPEVPGSSGVGSVTWDHGGLRFSLGATYIGSWVGYDWLAFYNGEVGNTPQRATLRDYLMDYPPIFKPYVSLTRSLGRGFEGYVRVENLENDQRNERDNLQVVPGRTAVVGIRIGR